MSQPNRQAIDTIRGYLYQFDHTILQILNHEDENAIFTVEGIEDIDIEKIGSEKVAIQCKYYEKSDFTPSKIKEAVVWMVKDFSKRVQEGKELIQYKLFGHYKSGQDKIQYPIDITYLKDSLLTSKTQEKTDVPSVTTKIHEELGLNDENLTLFLSKLTLNIDGLTLDEQHASILKKLAELYVCSDGDAEFFYAKSIYIIRNLAKNQLETERKIKKSRFIDDLKNSKKMIFDYWYLEKVSLDKYCKSIRKKYFNDTQSKRNRFFLIDVMGLEFHELKEIVKNISDRWSNLNTKIQPEKFCPFVYLHNIKNEELVRLKRDLMLDHYIVEDGYYFKGSDFNVDLYLREVLEHGNSYRTKVKFINTLDELSLVLSKLHSNKEIYQIYTQEPYYEVSESCDVFVKNVEYMKEILCGK